MIISTNEARNRTQADRPVYAQWRVGLTEERRARVIRITKHPKAGTVTIVTTTTKHTLQDRPGLFDDGIR